MNTCRLIIILLCIVGLHIAQHQNHTVWIVEFISENAVAVVRTVYQVGQ